MALTSEHDDTIAPKPVAVSSVSSLETAGSDPHDGGHLLLNGIQNISTAPSIVRSMPTTSSSIGGDNYGIQTSSFTAMPSSISLVTNQLRSPSTGAIIPSVTSANTVPEFLYQLTKMLTDNNRDIIEWSNGKIEVHNPHKLQTHVLNKYFRHSKFASFQRQLNYFGFRKLAGKGKMAPCSYVNDATTNELRSLLLIKRKTGNEPKSKSTDKKQTERLASYAMPGSRGSGTQDASTVDPTLARIYYSSGDNAKSAEINSHQSVTGEQPNESQQALARVAVGRGIRHSFSIAQSDCGTVLPAKAEPIRTVESPVQAGLYALTSNFQNSLQQESTSQIPTLSSGPPSTSSQSYVPGSLRRDDSLVDLAMIPMVEGDTQEEALNTSNTGFTFIDFPWDPSYLQNDANIS